MTMLGFEKSCCPESVSTTSINGKDAKIIFSEEAGKACNNVPYTYIAASFKNSPP